MVCARHCALVDGDYRDRGLLLRICRCFYSNFARGEVEMQMESESESERISPRGMTRGEEDDEMSRV